MSQKSVAKASQHFLFYAKTFMNVSGRGSLQVHLSEAILFNQVEVLPHNFAAV